jgi:hypothetical protein
MRVLPLALNELAGRIGQVEDQDDLNLRKGELRLDGVFGLLDVFELDEGEADLLPLLEDDVQDAAVFFKESSKVVLRNLARR